MRHTRSDRKELYFSIGNYGSQICYSVITLATEVHPDKNHGDPKAAEDFIALGEAYQVLIDPEKRGWYNKHGKLCIPQDFWLHSYCVYGMVYGSECFKDYIGEFASTTFLSCLEMEEEAEDPEVRKKRAWEKTQKLLEERHENLTKIMIDRIQPYVDGHIDEFEKLVDSEARRLSTAAFGECLLHTLGIAYMTKAANELKGKEECGRTKWIKVNGPKGFEMRSQIHAAKESERTVGRLDRTNQSQHDKEEDLRLHIFSYLNNWRIDNAWSTNVVDIDTISSYICKAILKDSTVSKDVLRLRAEALAKLGKIFKGANPPYRREYNICLEDGQQNENEDSDYSD
ncbi:chaperone protein dnaJ 10-like isoform X2 [Rosa rugosa]|uniref:chaperone protein dnaJ 10-like isoform X2 n=1 Tax=Rosa rugosa TaxID=74645 RepID=UPI002B41222B|nr:chaperone protein dnaJ 10-like isoform X2 [Rosa rugosa]